LATEAPSPRLARFVALSDLALALLVGVPCIGKIYVILSGRFRNFEWADPTQSLHLNEWGLLLCAACILSGLGLWRFTLRSRWIETALIVPKLYGVYALFFYPYAITRSWVFLTIMLAAIGNTIFASLLWLPAARTTLRSKG
jgi:hypothetical protein